MATSGEPTIPPTPAPIPEEPMAPGVPPTEVPMAVPPKRITSGCILAIVGGLLTVIGLFLPWFSVTAETIVGGSMSFPGILFGIWGILVLIFGILMIVLAAVKKPLIAGIFGILGLVFALIPILIIEGMLAPLAGLAGMTGVTWGPTFGWFLTLIGAVLAMIGGFVGHKQM